MKNLSNIYFIVFFCSIILYSCDNEDIVNNSNFRKFSVGCSKQINRVYEYLPAPGQFINKGFDCSTMEDAVKYAESRIIENNSFISLGGFGGYIIMGFDHSIKNIEGKDFLIKGNPFAGSKGSNCEPGIVMVMQDENGNGLPDDIWYELKGENHDDKGTIKNYSITYYKPQNGPGNIKWEDNQDNKGQITYLEFHQQIYYPKWINEDNYTLKGTLLKHRTVLNNETGYWSNNAFGDGYADNLAYTEDSNGNKFDISNAIDSDGNPANLEFIDFIKVYTAVNAEAGNLGELSTEILNVQDINPEY